MARGQGRKEEFLRFLNNLSEEFFSQNSNTFVDFRLKLVSMLVENEKSERGNLAEVGQPDLSDPTITQQIEEAVSMMSVLEVQRDWFDQQSDSTYVTIKGVLPGFQNIWSPELAARIQETIVGRLASKILKPEGPLVTTQELLRDEVPPKLSGPLPDEGFTSKFLNFAVIMSIVVIVTFGMAFCMETPETSSSEEEEKAEDFGKSNKIGATALMVGVLVSALGYWLISVDARVYFGYMSSLILTGGCNQTPIHASGGKRVMAATLLLCNMAFQVASSIAFGSKLMGFLAINGVAEFIYHVSTFIFGEKKADEDPSVGEFLVGLIKPTVLLLVPSLLGLLARPFITDPGSVGTYFETGVFLMGNMTLLILLLGWAVSANKGSERKSDFGLLGSAGTLLVLGSTFPWIFSGLAQVINCFGLAWGFLKLLTADFPKSPTSNIVGAALGVFLAGVLIKTWPNRFIFW